MSLRDQFYDNDESRPRIGSKGPCWNGKGRLDFVRGRIESVAVKMGTDLKGSPSRKVVLVMTDAIGHITTEDEEGNREGKKFATSEGAPNVSIVSDGPRGGALAKALDEAAPLCTMDQWIQVRYIGQAKAAEKGKSKAVYWEIKVWDGQPAPGVPPVVTLDMSQESSERVPLAVPDEAVPL
jgi:hypothetical protein